MSIVLLLLNKEKHEQDKHYNYELLFQSSIENV